MLQDPNRGELEDHNKATVSESAVSNRPGVSVQLPLFLILNSLNLLCCTRFQEPFVASRGLQSL